MHPTCCAGSEVSERQVIRRLFVENRSGWSALRTAGNGDMDYGLENQGLHAKRAVWRRHNRRIGRLRGRRRCTKFDATIRDEKMRILRASVFACVGNAAHRHRDQVGCVARRWSRREGCGVGSTWREGTVPYRDGRRRPANAFGGQGGGGRRPAGHAAARLTADPSRPNRRPEFTAEPATANVHFAILNVVWTARSSPAI